MDERRGEVCLELEVERLREEGLRAGEISQKLGLDRSWVEEWIRLLEGAPEDGEKDA